MKIFLAAAISILMSLALLLILLTKQRFEEMKDRGQLMLCLKETKGEIHEFILLIEKTNWAIRNIDKAKYLVFIPGLQAVALNSQRARELIINYQNLQLIKFLSTLTILKKRCSFNLEVFKTPYRHKGIRFDRHFNGTAVWRKKWTPQVKAKYEIAQFQITKRKPQIQYRYKIKKGNALSLIPSLWGSSPSLSDFISL